MADTLRMHVYVPDPSDPRGSHAWLSLEQNGRVTTYGLQGDGSEHIDRPEQAQPRTSSGERTDLRQNCDGAWEGKGEVIREKQLSAEELARFQAWTDQPQQYSTRSNNCAHATRDGWQAATGERFEVVQEQPSRFETGAVERFSCPAGLARSVELAPPTSENNRNVGADFGRAPPPPEPPPPPEQAPTKTLKH